MRAYQYAAGGWKMQDVALTPDELHSMLTSGDAELIRLAELIGDGAQIQTYTENDPDADELIERLTTEIAARVAAAEAARVPITTQPQATPGSKAAPVKSGIFNNFNRLVIGKRDKSDRVEVIDDAPQEAATVAERTTGTPSLWQAMAFYSEAYRREQWRKRREAIENDTTGKSYAWKPTRPARA